MKLLGVLILVCLLVTGMASAKAVDSAISSSVVNPAIASPGIFTYTAYTECSDDSASVGTAIDMGDLDVDSIPDGSAIYLDGARWSRIYCTGIPPTCFPMPILSPYVGNVATGTHSITIAHAGYKNYTGTVNICSQKVSYVHKDLVLVPTTTITTATTTPATTVTTAVTTTTTTTAVTTAAASTTAAAATTAPVVAVTSAAPAGTGGAVPAGTGTGSLSVTTTPAGAAVYVDGVQRAVSPAVIPGLAAGSHTVVLKLAGYQELSTPVQITAGTTGEFSTGLVPLGAAGTAAPAVTTAAAAATTAPAPAATKAQSPGFGLAAGIAALGSLVILKRRS